MHVTTLLKNYLTILTYIGSMNSSEKKYKLKYKFIESLKQPSIIDGCFFDFLKMQFYSDYKIYFLPQSTELNVH